MRADFFNTETDASQDDSNFCNKIYETYFADNADNIFNNKSDELAIVELNCLYNIASYVLSRLDKKNLVPIAMILFKVKSRPVI